jgi:hypothetical protein
MFDSWIIAELLERDKERQRDRSYGPIPLYIEPPEYYPPPPVAEQSRRNEDDEPEERSHIIIIEMG